MPIVVALVLAAAAQHAPPPPRPAIVTTEEKPASDDVVVTGLRDLGTLTDLDDPASPVRPKTLGSSRTGAGGVASRSVFALSQRLARCAVQRSPASLAMLRATLDGRINGSTQVFSQGRLGRMHSACLVDVKASGTTGLSAYDGTYYDRGAMFIEALKAFAPGLRLTAAQTGDPVVQRRFDAREISLARFRLPVDRRYFEIAVCLVRLQPELSARLALTDGPPGSIDRLEAAIVNRGKLCVGNAKNVYFDATQFRFYIADAVYRWTVAAQGVATLIPER